MKTVYPVIFTRTEDGFLIQVPDLEIFTEGTDINNAIYMARDAISIKLVSKEENGESFISMVDVDTDEYRQKIDSTPVRRNVSLPRWLNNEVNEAGINVSRVLQDALMEKLSLNKRI